MLRPESRDGKRVSALRPNSVLNRERPFQSAPPGSAIHHHRPPPLAGRDEGRLFGFKAVMIRPGGAIHAMAGHGLDRLRPAAPQDRSGP